MKVLTYILMSTLLLWATSCSKVNYIDRKGGQEDTEIEPLSNSSEAQNGPRPRDEGVTPDDYVNADAPNAITGVRLAGVEIIRQCIKTQHGTCNKIQLTAMVTAVGKDPVLYDAQSKASLGIETATWEVSVPNGTCVTNGYNGLKPLCKANGSESLVNSSVTAKLELKSRGVSGTTTQTDVSKAKAASDSANITLTPPASGLTPSGNTPSGANVKFQYIWQDQVTGVYLGNALTTGSDNVNYTEGEQICTSLNSGDGTGKWMIPGVLDIVDLLDHGILDIPTQGFAFFALSAWSSTGEPGPGGEVNYFYRFVHMGSGSIFSDEPHNENGLFCIRH